MFGTIRRHQTWLWAVIITLTIISFLYFFSPYQRQNGSRGPANFGTIDGVPIGEQDFVNARREIFLRHLFMTGSLPNDQDAKRTESEIYQRLLLIQRQQQMGIRVSSEAAARFTRDNLLRRMERNGPIQASEFVKKVLEPQGFSVADLQRFVEHELGVEELAATVGLSGQLSTPSEIQSLYIREHQELDCPAVFFSASNFLSGITTSPEAISQFYSNRLANYRLPERVQVRYVLFGVSNFLAQAEDYWAKTNLSEVIDMNLQQMGTNLFRDAKTPEESRAKLREEIIRSRALGEAARKAREFARPLIEDATNAAALDVAAATNGLVVRVSAPFDRESGPRDLDVGMDFIKAAFTRTAGQPFAPPITTRDGIYVFALERVLPSEIPTLDQIRERVAADYKQTQAAMSARFVGAEFYRTVTNAMAQGKDFATAAAEAKATVVPLPPFSISTRSLPIIEEHQITLDQLKQVAFSTPVGKVSEFQSTREGGFVLFVRAKQPLDQIRMARELPGYTTSVRQTRQSEAFAEWFRKEAERSLRDTPLFQQAPTGGAGRAAKS